MNTRITLAVVGAALLFAAISTGQSGSRVWPLSYANQPGQGSMAAPFSISGEHRFDTGRSVIALDDSALPFGAGSAIDSVAWRRDAVHQGSYSSSSGRLYVRVGRIADALAPTGTLDVLFAEPAVSVFDGTINLPSRGRPSSGTAPFDIVVTFSRPWTYEGGDFAIDTHFDGPVGTTWRRDAVQLERGYGGTFRQIGGAGCFGSNGFAPLTWCELDRAVPGGELAVSLKGAQALQPYGAALLLLGSASPTFGGIPLPLPLSLIGAPNGCELRTDILENTLELVADRSPRYGTAMKRMPIPALSQVTGSTLSVQWIVLDTGVGTQFPVTSSNTLAVTFGAASTAGTARYGHTLWTYGTSVFESQGLRRSPLNFVPVTQFRGTFVP